MAKQVHRSATSNIPRARGSADGILIAHLTSEDVAAAKVERQVLQEYGAGVQLLAHLAAQSTVEAARATKHPQFDRRCNNLRVAFMAMQQGASWSALRLIRTGYPKEALVFARTIREGYVADVWAAAFPQKALGMIPAVGKPLLRGKWKIGDMVEDLESLPDEDLPFPGSFPSDLLKSLRKIQNDLFAHAISDWSIFSMFEPGASDILVKSGPQFKRELTEVAINHLMPLVLLMTVDASVMCELVTQEHPTHETLQVARRASAWITSHGVPTLEHSTA